MLDDAAMLPRGFEQQAAFAKDMAGRLFEIHVFASKNSLHSDGAMPMVRCGHKNGIDGMFVEHASEIAELARSMSEHASHEFGGGGAASLVHVAHGGDLHISPAREFVEVGLIASAGAD